MARGQPFMPPPLPPGTGGEEGAVGMEEAHWGAPVPPN